MLNANSPEYLDKLLTQLIKNLEHTKHAPSVQMHYTPNDREDLGDVEEDSAEAKDTKGGSQYAIDNTIQQGNEFYEDDDKAEGIGSKNIENHENGEPTVDIKMKDSSNGKINIDSISST